MSEPLPKGHPDFYREMCRNGDEWVTFEEAARRATIKAGPLSDEARKRVVRRMIRSRRDDLH